MPAGIYLDEQELDALRGLPLLARVMYVESLRPRMDYSSGTVGARDGARLSWRGVHEDCYEDPHAGLVGVGGLYTLARREQLRRACAWLVRRGLVQVRSDMNAQQLILFLPKARLLSRAQIKPVPNPLREPVRGATEGKSTGTRTGGNVRSRDTSEIRAVLYQSGGSDGSKAARWSVDDLAFPQQLTEPQRQAVIEIARRAALTREHAQLVLDELRNAIERRGVRNPPRLVAEMVKQLRDGTFAGSGALAVRAGGKALSREEAQLLNQRERGKR